MPSKYRDGGASVLERLAEDDAHLADIFDLDNATNDRLWAENEMLPGIRRWELVFGVPYYRIVNATFCHPRPEGSRFNGPDRGAWYAAFHLSTAQREIAHHKWRELAEIGWSEEETVTFDDYLADFSAEFHDLRGAPAFQSCLDPDSYQRSQALARDLLEAGSAGTVYPSVRHARGTCVACFRPPLVMNVRRDATYAFTWSGQPEPKIASL